MATRSIAVLIPCYNETLTIARTIAEFRSALPEAVIYVYDNNSSDDTIPSARQAGAVVRSETLQGKGNVIRRMFSDIEADIYVMVDGDATYDAASAPTMIAMLENEKLDMVNAIRVTEIKSAYRPGHRFGNLLFTGLVARLFGNRFHDMLSGYRVFSRRFVKSFPALSIGFEIETELTVHALELSMPVGELKTPYRDRPEGSVSKLNTWRDGMRVLWTILALLKEKRPLFFFSFISFVLAFISVELALPLLETYLQTGKVPRFPTAIMSTGIMILSFLSLASGLILDSVMRAHVATKRLFYLNVR